jgi:hypothetical protein
MAREAAEKGAAFIPNPRRLRVRDLLFAGTLGNDVFSNFFRRVLSRAVTDGSKQRLWPFWALASIRAAMNAVRILPILESTL